MVAADGSSSKVLWRVKILHDHIKFWMEEDQWIYITDLKLTNNSLLLRDERSPMLFGRPRQETGPEVRLRSYFLAMILGVAD